VSAVSRSAQRLARLEPGVVWPVLLLIGWYIVANRFLHFPLLEAKQALEFLATGSAEGKIVLSVNAS
jgi:hypothetical protein